MLKSTWKKNGIRRYIGPKRAILFLGFIFFMFWVWDYYKAGFFNLGFIEHYRHDHPIRSVILFILIYVVSVIASLPSLPLNLAAGYFWGGLLGGIYSTLSVTIGGWVSFALARRLIGQPLAKKFDRQWVNKVQNEFDKEGWKFVAFARINPIIPTGPLNYLLGLTSLTNKGFLWATFVFLLPPAIAVAYIGDSFQTFTQQDNVNVIIRGVLVVSAAITFLVGVKFASGLLKKRVDKE